MKLELLLTVSLFAGIACARPVVSNVDFTQTGSSRKVTVTYNLSGGPAIVTMDVQTNGVSIGRDNFAGALEGDVNRVVDGPSGCIVWRAKQSWPNQEGVGITVQLTAWATNAPPDYVVVDLVDGSRSYHQSLDELSPAFGDDVYKIRKMVLRKIPAAGVEWTMGIQSNMFNYSTANQAHRVVLTQDYYIGVYPVTQGQWEKVMDGHCTAYNSYATTPRPSWFTNEQYYATRPVEYIPLRAIYGENTDMQAYPQHERILRPGRFLYEIRERTGLAFDLPTSAQWEFAARAGTTTSLYTGRDICREVNAIDAVGARLGMAFPDHKSDDPAKNLRHITPAEGGTATVGGGTPNAWNLYDLYGNVDEYVADWYSPYWYMDCLKAGLSVDPKGYTGDWETLYNETPKRHEARAVVRGGGFSRGNTGGSSVQLDGGGDMYTGVQSTWGFRVIIHL